MKSLFYLVTIFLFLHVFVTASPLIQDSCKKAAALDPKLNLNFCVQSFKGNPQSKTAKNLLELTMVSFQNGATKAKSFEANIKKNLDQKKYPKNIDVQIRECIEFYQYQVEAFESASKEIKKHNYTRAMVQIDDCYVYVDACEVQFEKTPTDSPLTKEKDVMTRMLEIILAFTIMLK